MMKKPSKAVLSYSARVLCQTKHQILNCKKLSSLELWTLLTASDNEDFDLDHKVFVPMLIFNLLNRTLSFVQLWQHTIRSCFRNGIKIPLISDGKICFTGLLQLRQ